MDVLDDILRTMRLKGGVFLDARFTAPWCIVSQIAPEDCSPFMPAPTRLIAYHYVVDGTFLASSGSAAPATVRAGELIIFPRNDPHRLGSANDVKPVDAGSLIEPAGADGLARISYGGGGAASRIYCGYLGCGEEIDPLVSGLPTFIRLGLSTKPRGAWIGTSIEYAMRELVTGGPAAGSSLARLAELLFAEAVREYADNLPNDKSGWLAGLRDPIIGKALALVHTDLSRNWTLDELAGEIGASRSILAERFTNLIGVSPMRYVSRRRLVRAADQLRESTLPITKIAETAGYDSESAFSRAFKRAYGSAPGSFRNSVRHS